MTIANPIVHRGHPDVGPVTPPQVSQYVTVSWAWVNESQGSITWTFVNSDQSNSHAVVLYRGGAETPTYIFGGAFWPVYLSAGYGFSMLDGTQPLPTLGGSDTQPMGLLDFGPSASPRYLVAFIFNLAPGQTWSTPEGFTPNAGPTTFLCYELVSNVTGNYCAGYDPARVAQWHNQGNTGNGYSPNPMNFFTYAFTPESATPENALGYNDSIAAGTCAPQNFYVVTGKNNFGRDEVQDNLKYPDAFYLFLEGLTPNAVGSSIPSPVGSFNSTNIPGLSFSTTPSIIYDIGNTGVNLTVPQRIRFGYEVDFTSASLASPTAFPAPGAPPNSYTLGASISIQGQAALQSPNAEFFLLGGDDPYFTNINAGAGVVDPQYYLSQDLRVFTITPTANNQTPIGNVPFAFQGGSPTVLDTAAGFSYIQNLITWLNQQIGYLNTSYTPPDTNTFDPLDTLLPNQNGALEGDSSVTPNTGSNVNYNFAVARVRLKGSSGKSAAASNVKVFFRLFTTQTFDTDFIDSTSAATNADPNVTYPSTGSSTNPLSPQPGTDGNGNVNGCSLPCFATANYNDGPSDYDPGGANNQTIEIPSNQDYAWAFYGCFLNVNDATNEFGTPPQPVQYWLAGSAHNCLVAQIAYNLAPILNIGGVIENPQNSDKLAQRNLQVTTSGNPGFPVTHRVPQTIDVRPSPPAQSADPASILSYPDEMMIDWGETPLGSVANIYWPGASAATVLQLAQQLYPAQPLSAADAHTVQCQVVSPVTYIPIPPGAGGSFAGLLTIDLPATVRYGNAFDVLVRRITTRRVVRPTPPNNPPPPQVTAAVNQDQLLWRYVTGSFLARISVQQERKILPVDENLLAILKWRLGLIGLGNRWYPILLRYINALSGRIDGMGGNASEVPPSPIGYQPPTTGPGEHAGEHDYTGKVTGLFYDRFGDFEGFDLRTEGGEQHSFRAREHNLEELVYRAWVERFVITLRVRASDVHRVVSVTLRRAPRSLRH